MYVKKITSVISIAVLAACASSGPNYSQTQISQAQKSGTLENLYQQMQGELTTVNPSSSKGVALKASLQEAGERLAKTREDELRSGMRPASKDISLFSLDVLTKAQNQAEAIKAWDGERYQSIYTQLQEMRDATSVAIDRSLLSLGSLGDSQAEEKLQELDKLIALVAGDAGEEFKLQQVEYLDELYEKGLQAIESKQYTLARNYLGAVRSRNPDYKELNSLWPGIDVGTQEQSFWDSLAQGKPDDAYQQFVVLAESENFSLVKEQVSSAAGDITNYFLEVGQKAQKQGDFAKAYESFHRARYIRDSLDQGDKFSKADLKFIKVVEGKYKKAKKDKDIGIAYGYLSIIKQLDSANSAVKRDFRGLKVKALREAEVKVAAAPFSNATSDREFGKGLSSKVSQYLLEKIPDDITLLQQDQFKSLKQNKDWNPSMYLSYYMVEGNIQQSEVDTTEKRVNKIKRVTTSYKKAPNPAHEKWSDLSKSKRKKTPEPSATIDIPQTEDINLGSVIVEKTGIFSAIFRLVDPITHEVLFVDSVEAKKSYEGESVEGVELGVFKQEGKAADLPADSEILEELAKEVAIKVGDSLIQKLVNPEAHYENYAIRAVQEDNVQAAARNFAYALVLAERKGKDVNKLKAEMRATVAKIQ